MNAFRGRHQRWLLILWLLLSAAPRAFAQHHDQREVHARELFALGRYSEALAIYGKLYAETSHPTYLRNIGRCYQNLGEPDKAIGSFREYLRQATELPPDQRAIIDGYIREMEQLKVKREEVAAPPPPQPRAAPEVRPIALNPSPPEPPPAPVVRQAPAIGKVSAGGASDENGGSSRRIAAYAVAGASLASLGVGAFFGAQAIRNEHDSETLCPGDPCGGQGLSLNHSARTDARVADFTVGAGLVGAGVATYLFLSSTASGSEAPQDSVAGRLRFAPELAGNRLALTAAGSW